MEDGAIGHKVTRAMLDERFVLSVGNIVEGVTEPNKDLPWKVRKQEALERIKIMQGPTLWVKSADVISNVSELLDDYGHDGDDVFLRFNAPKKDIIANYIAVLRALIERWEEFENPLVADLKTLVDDLEELSIEPVDKVEDNFTYFKKPIQCFLWKKDKLVSEDLHYQNLETIETFVDDGHFSRRLMKCKECGQLYFKEFYETTDYIGGNDPQYITLVPVYSKEDIEKLKATSMFELLEFRPHISSNWPADADRPSVCWVWR